MSRYTINSIVRNAVIAATGAAVGSIVRDAIVIRLKNR